MMESFGLYVGLFFCVILLVYIPFLHLYMKRRKDKATVYEHEHPEAVKIYFKRVEIDDTLEVISVDNEKPVIHSKGTRHGFYLLPGTHIIHVTCFWADISITALSGYGSHTIRDEKFNVTVEANKEYLLYCNRTTEKFEFKET